MTGLRFSSTSEIQESYRGRIIVESRPGKGSVFRVMLPLEEQIIQATDR